MYVVLRRRVFRHTSLFVFHRVRHTTLFHDTQHVKSVRPLLNPVFSIRFTCLACVLGLGGLPFGDIDCFRDCEPLQRSDDIALGLEIVRKDRAVQQVMRVKHYATRLYSYFFTSRRITSSLVAMEALASGTPVIAFRFRRVPEIVEHGRTGFIMDGKEEIAVLNRSGLRQVFDSTGLAPNHVAR